MSPSVSMNVLGCRRGPFGLLFFALDRVEEGVSGYQEVGRFLNIQGPLLISRLRDRYIGPADDLTVFCGTMAPRNNVAQMGRTKQQSCAQFALQRRSTVVLYMHGTAMVLLPANGKRPESTLP